MKALLFSLIYFFIGLFIFPLPSFSSDVTNLSYKDYKVSSGDIVKTYFKAITIRKDGMIEIDRKIESKNYIQNETYLLDENYATINWQHIREDKNTDYKGKRVDNTLFIKGMLDKKKIDKAINLDDKPFFNHPKTNLSKFILSEEKEILFWGMRKKTLKTYLMSAKKTGIKTINVKENNYEVIEVKLEPDRGPFKKYYKRTYYFRKSDGLFIKKKSSKGRSTEIISNN